METKQEAATSEPQEQRQVSPEEMRQKYAAMRQSEWDKIANGERFLKAQRKGYVDSDRKLTDSGAIKLSPIGGPRPALEIVTLEQLVALIPLEGDTMRYATKIGDMVVGPRLSENKLGFISFPKTQGRRKPRPNQHQQTIKNKSIGLFRQIFGVHVSVLESEAKAQGQPFNGVPNDDIPKMGARAAKLAMHVVATEGRARRRKARRTQELSRRINRGLTPGNVNKRRFINS